MIKFGKLLIRLGKISVLITVFIILVCVVSYGVMLLPPVQNYACSVAEEKLDSVLKGDVKIGRIRSNLLSRTDIYNLKVLDKFGRDDSVSLGHLRVRYNILALLNRTVHITSIFGNDINASLSVTSERVYSIPVLPDSAFRASRKKRKLQKDSSTEKSGWKVVIGRARLRNFNAAFKDSCRNFTGVLRKTNIRARFPQIDSIMLDLRVPDASYESRWWNGDLDTIGATAVLKFDGLQLLDLHVEGSGSKVRGKGKIPFKKKGIWDLDVQVSTSMAPVSAIHGYVPDVRPVGDLWADVSWKGTLKDPVLEFEAKGSGLRYCYIDIDTMALFGEYKNGSWASTKGMVLSSLGKANLNVRLQIPGLMRKPKFEDYQGSIRIDNARLSLLKEKLMIDQKNIPGKYANVECILRGHGFKSLPEHLQIRINAEDSDLGKDTLMVAADLHNKQWVINGRLGNDLLNGSGRIQSNGSMYGTIDGSIKNVRPSCSYFLKQNVSGNLKFKALLSGLVQNPFIQYDINSSRLRWKSIHVDTFHTTGSYYNKEVMIDNGYSRLFANLGTVTRFFKFDSIGGVVGATLQVSGPVSSLDVGCKLSGSKLFYKNYRADSVNANITVNDYNKISWQKAYIRSDSVEVKTNGSFDLKRKHTDTDLAIQINTSGKKKDAGSAKIEGLLGPDSILANFKTSNLFLSSFSPWINIRNFNGTISAEGTFTGNYRNLQGNVNARLNKPGFKMYRLALVDCHMALVDSLLSVSSEIYLRDKKSVLHLNGTLPLMPSAGWKFDTTSNRDARAVLIGNNIDLSVIASILDSGSVARGHSNINLELLNNHGRWNLSGGIELLDGYYTGKDNYLTINDVRFLSTFSGSVFDPRMEYFLSTGAVAINNSRVDSLSIAGASTVDMLRINKSQFWFPGSGTVDLGVRLPLNNFDSLFTLPGFQIDFNINKFPLAFLSPFVSENMIRSGEVNGNGTIAITKGRPVLSGDIRMQNAKFAFEDIDPVVGPVNMQIALRQDSLLVNRINAKCGKGNIKGDGFIIWSKSGLDDMKINLKSTDLHFDIRDLASLRIQNGNIKISNKRDGGYLIAGGIELGDTRVIRDLRIADLIEQVHKNNISVEKDPFLESLSLKLEVKLLDNLEVDINLGDLKAGGEIAITGTAAKPIYTGEIRINEGYTYYFDRKFDITNGTFYNYDPYELDPLIDLEAMTEVDAISTSTNGALQTVESYTIYLSVQGKLSKPEVRLWSEGTSLDEGNIISILTFGQPLGAVGGDLGARLKAFAQQTVIGFGARKLEQILGIERIDLKGNIFDFDSEDSPTLSLTKRFSPRFLLSYETALGDLTKPKVTAMFRLTKHFFLEGQTDVDDYGLDFLFKFSR